MVRDWTTRARARPQSASFLAGGADNGAQAGSGYPECGRSPSGVAPLLLVPSQQHVVTGAAEAVADRAIRADGRGGDDPPARVAPAPAHRASPWPLGQIKGGRHPWIRGIVLTAPIRPSPEGH